MEYLKLNFLQLLKEFGKTQTDAIALYDNAENFTLNDFMKNRQTKNILLCSLFAKIVTESNSTTYLNLINQFLEDYRNTDVNPTPVEGMKKFIELFDVDIVDGNPNIIFSDNITDEDLALMQAFDEALANDTSAKDGVENGN
jgi:hypothetical protein